jgi:hypothetical protein
MESRTNNRQVLFVRTALLLTAAVILLLPIIGTSQALCAESITCTVTVVFSPDTDADGLTDASEEWLQTDPGNPDTDSDGMPDGWEFGYGLNPTNPAGADGPTADLDGDEAGNLAEYIADTDPLDSNSVLTITGISMDPTGIRIEWQGGEDAEQSLQFRQRLNATAQMWTAFYSNQPPTALTTNVTDSTATNIIRFYRIKAGRP